MRVQNALRAVCLLAVLLVLVWTVPSGAALQKGSFKERPKKVYFVESVDLEALKTAFVNINLHLRGEGRLSTMDYKVVVHGSTVRYFVDEGTDPDLLYMVQWFLEEGIAVELCVQCAERYGIAPSAVLPGVTWFRENASVGRLFGY